MGTLPLLLVLAGDFPICQATQSQYYPAVYFAHDQYYVFWSDRRFYDIDRTFSVFGARVSTDGKVLDPNGKQIFRDSSAYQVNAAYDGTNFLVVFRNHC